PTAPAPTTQNFTLRLLRSERKEPPSCRDSVAGATRVGARHHQPVSAAGDRGDAAHEARPRADLLHAMPGARDPSGPAGAGAILDHEGRTFVMAEARRLDRLLDVHAPLGKIDEDLEDRLRLPVIARRRYRQRRAVAEEERRAERVERPHLGAE